MARIAGFKIDKDSKGQPSVAHINLKKFPEVLRIGQLIGAIEVDADWENALTPDEFMQEVDSMLKRKFNVR